MAKHAEASKMGADGAGGKPGLWSWHLIPTSCRLSEQLQGRILLLNCNVEFEKDRKPLKDSLNNFEKKKLQPVSVFKVILSLRLQPEGTDICDAHACYNKICIYFF